MTAFMLLGARWAHHEYGSKPPHGSCDFARCLYCGEDIAWWARSSSLPSSVRKSIDEHLATHGAAL